MGSNPVEASDFFLGCLCNRFLCNCFSCFTTAKITFTCVFYDFILLDVGDVSLQVMVKRIRLSTSYVPRRLSSDICIVQHTFLNFLKFFTADKSCSKGAEIEGLRTIRVTCSTMIRFLGRLSSSASLTEVCDSSSVT